MKKITVSIIVVTYNSEQYIQNCLESLKKIAYSYLELIIVDNNSQDKTVSVIEAFLPTWSHQKKLIRNKKNLGYAQANNIGVDAASGAYVCILNPDTLVTDSFLEPLVAKLESDETIAVGQPTVYLLKDKKTINLTGKVTQYLGFDWIKNYKSTQLPFDQEIVSFSGSGVLIKKDIFLKAGGYDEQYFMYYEDSDLSWKIRLMGYKIWYVAKSSMLHDYKLVPQESYLSSKQKLFFAEKNRLITVLKNYSTKTLLLLLPAFLLMEVMLIGYALLNGWLVTKLKAYLAVWHSRRLVLAQRNFIQHKRKLSDAQIIEGFEAPITFSGFSHPVVHYVLNPILILYWNIVRLVI